MSSMAAITVSENNSNGACANMNTLIFADRVHPSAEELVHGSL